MITLKAGYSKLVRWLWYLVASGILFAAVVISLFRFALNEVEGYQKQIEDIASRAIQRRVHIEALDARLVGLTPTLILKGIHILDEDGVNEILRIDETDIGVAILRSLRHRTLVPSNVVISGTRLALVRKTNGQIALHGLELDARQTRQESNNELTGWFLSQSSLAVKNSVVVWKDYRKKHGSISFSDIDVEIINRGDRHKLKGSFSPGTRQGKRVEMALDLTGDLRKPGEWQGSFFVQGDEIFLTHWGEKITYKNTELKKGIADFQVWGEWEKGRLTNMDGDISVYQLTIRDNESKKNLDINLLGGLFNLDIDKQGWLLNIDRFQYTGIGGILPETAIMVKSQNNENEQPANVEIKIGKFNLQSISEILLNSSLLSKSQQDYLKSFNPSGNVEEFRFNYVRDGSEANGRFEAYARLNGVSNTRVKKIPGLTNLTGAIWLDNEHGKLELNTSNALLDLGGLFRAPIKVGEASGTINWRKFRHGWQVNSEALNVSSNEAVTKSNLMLYIPDQGSTYMDLFTYVAGDIQYKSNYLPVAIMKPKLVKWLDESLVSGKINRAGAVFRGRFKDFPFRKPAGQFRVQLEAEQVELKYHDDWLPLTNALVDASFTSKGLSIDVKQAKMVDSNVSQGRIKIADYRAPRVDIETEVSGGMRDVVNFVVNSPLKLSKELLDIHYQGQAHTSASIHVDLQHGAQVGYNGNVRLVKGRIGLMGGALDIANINGDMQFANSGLSSSNLHADIFGRTSKLNLYSQVINHRNKTYIATDGESDIQKVLKSLKVPAYKHVSGSTRWQALLDFSDERRRVPRLNITSDLEGVELSMPAPMQKTAAQKNNLELEIYFLGKGSSEIFANYNEQRSMAIQLESDAGETKMSKAHLQLARGTPRLPKGRLVYITGSMNKFRPSTWGEYIASYPELSSDSKTKKLPILLKMSRLDVVLEENKKQGDTNILPRSFPAISGSVNEFVFDGMTLGKLKADFVPLGDQVRVNGLSINSEFMNFSSTGYWKYENKQHASSVDVSLTSKNMGKLFKSLGLAAIINDGKADIKGNIHWSGTPFDFSLARMAGNLAVHVEDGSVSSVDPGAGRVVGLLSLAELPRRLMLDFSDMFKSGFVFDEAKGNVSIKNGSAYSSALNVEGSIAEVILKGRVGLVARDYDQVVRVIPKVGDTLPVTSGAIFGPQIGAIVYLFEKIFGKELEKATEREYRVTGSWENPVIKRVDIPPEQNPENDKAG